MYCFHDSKEHIYSFSDDNMLPAASIPNGYSGRFDTFYC